jgi:hypothetical protein
MDNKGTPKQKKDGSPFYKIIEDIRFKKEGKLLDNDDNLKAFTNFMALRFLSMDRDNIDIINALNQFQGVMDKKSMYDILIDVIPPKSGYIRYVSNKKSDEESEYISCVSEYYQCSIKEAKEYISIKGDEWAKEILKQFGGKV